MEQIEQWDLLLGDTYRKMYNMLLRYAELRFRQTSLAEEAVQETFRIACLKHEDFCASENREGWIMRTLQNVIKNEQRRRNRLDRLMAAMFAFLPDELPLASDDYTGIEYADLLTDEDFLLLKRVAIDRYSMKEAAEEFGISVEACKKQLQRARDKLRKRLMEIEWEPDTDDDDFTGK